MCVVLTIALWRVLSATEAAIAATEKTIEEAQTVAKQAKLAIMSAHGLTFDLRKNWTANVDMQTRTMERVLSALERTTRATEAAMSRSAAGVERVTAEVSSTVEETRNRIIPAVESAIAEVTRSVAGVQPVLTEASATIAAVRPVLDTTRAGIDGITAETKTAIAGITPILATTDALMCSAAGIVESGAKVAKHYETMILHPSKTQRLKGLLQLILSGFTVWGSAKMIF